MTERYYAYEDFPYTYICKGNRNNVIVPIYNAKEADKLVKELNKLVDEINSYKRDVQCEKLFEVRYNSDLLLSELYYRDEMIISSTNDLAIKNVCDLLNELNNENEQLKSKNRGLQSELQIFKEDVTHSNLQINKLADENEQLKSEKEHYKKQVDELDGLLNKYEITFEELEEILDNDYRERF